MTTHDTRTWAVIMAGGSGTRFWPLSRAALPKQLVRIVGDSTMIQATVARLQPDVPAERVLVVTTAAIVEETRRQLPMIPPEQIVAEPIGRDTAACVALAAYLVRARDPEAVMVLLSADQVIAPAEALQRTLRAGVEIAAGGRLVTFGIQPRFPATGYGYIKLGESLAGDGIAVNEVAAFVEKPDAATAAAYLADGGYRWNAGIFAWRATTVLEELDRHCPQLIRELSPVADAIGGPDFEAVLARCYDRLDKISIDYALMEKAEGIAVVTCTFDWDDVGSWDALYAHIDSDEAGLRSRGTVYAEDCRDSLLVEAGGPAITAIGLEGISVVSTPDAILVVPKGRSQEVKLLYERLKGERPDLV